MSEEITEGNDSPSTQTESENMNWEQFIEKRGGIESTPVEDNTSVDEAGKPTEVGSSQTTSENQVKNPADTVLSNIDLDSLSKEDISKLSKGLNSRALSRFSELTAKRKAAEAELKQLKEQQQPPKNVPQVKNNPLAESSVEDLHKAKDAADELIEWADNILYEHEDAGSQEIVAEVEGKEFTKAEVKKSLRHHKNVLEKYIPARIADIQREGQTKELAEGFKRQAVKELGWIKDKNNPVTKHYEAMINDPRVKDMVSKVSSDLNAQMPYILAHAANSMYGRKLVGQQRQTPAPQKINRQPIITPTKVSKPVVSKSDKPKNRSSQVISQAMNKFAETGNKSDFVSLRTQQLTRK